LISLRRREALLLAAAAALVGPRGARATQSSLPALLARTHQLELATAVAYDAAAGNGLPDDVAVAFARHERDQAVALRQALEALGAQTLDVPTTTSDVAALVPGFPAAGASGPERARYLIAVERATLDAHRAVLGATHHPEVLRTVASIMAAAGTHLAVLRDRIGASTAATL
jgi:hypothetical protein